MSRDRLDPEDLLLILSEATGPGSRVRDAGILYAATCRPAARMLGEPVYRTVVEKAAALMHSIICWRPLDIWNAGFAWRAVAASLGLTGLTLSMPAEERMAITGALTTGEIDTVDELAIRLAPYLAVAE